jgi:hypothetical protein
VQPEYSNGQYIKAYEHFWTYVRGKPLKVYQREKIGEGGRPEVLAASEINFLLSSFRKRNIVFIRVLIII